MKYGYIIRFNNLKSFFFIHYVDSEILKLIDNTKDINTIIEYNIQKDIIEKNISISVIYKPYTSSYILLNGYSLGKLLNISYTEKSDTENIYKIIKINEQEDILTIENIESKKVDTIHFNFRGLPNNIHSIKKIEVTNNYNKDNRDNESVKENKKENNNGEYYYYYSIEQQVSGIIEDLLTSDKENDKREHKKIMKIIKRYIELNNKHYNENNEYIKIKNIFNKETLEENKTLYTPLSNNIKIKKYQVLDTYEEDKVSDKLNGFYLNNEPIDFFTNFLYNEISDYDLLNQISYDEPFDKSKYRINVKKGQDIYLGPGGDLYNLILQENMDININGLLSKTKDIIKYEMSNTRTSTLLDKSISNYPYISKYALNNYDINDNPNIKGCDFFLDKPVIYKIKGDYDEFVKKITPDTFKFIQCFSGNYFSLINVTNHLSLLDIYELNKNLYKKIVSLISKHIKQYNKHILNEKTDKKRVNLENKVDPLNIKNSIESKKYFTEDYYTYGEYINNVNRKLLIFNIIKNNLHNRNDVIEIINNDDTSEVISKIYNNKSELLMDEGKNLLYKDILKTGEVIRTIYNVQYKSSIELLYELFRKSGFMGTIKEFVIFFKNEYDFNDIKYKDIKPDIEKFNIKYQIREGDKGYVIEEDILYLWDNISKRWITKTTIPNMNIQESANKLLKEYNINSELLKFKYSTYEYESLVKEIKYIENKKLKNELKYHNQKWKYAQVMNGITISVSPYLEFFHEIISQTDIKKKMKELYTFISICTIEGGENVKWLFCKETGIKLVPIFYKLLADAYNKDEDLYYNKIEELCNKQGKVEGNLYVDKYSGYTIKNINFDTEEGYTKDGFKIITREIMKNDEKKSVVVTKEDDYIYKNIITIIDLINIQLDEMDIQQMIGYINECKDNYKPTETKKEDKIFKDTTYLYSLLSVFFVYIQTYKDIDNLESFYLNCKPSFNGFPLESGDDKSGIEYILCIFDNARKNNTSYPWNVKEIKKMKIEELNNQLEECILKNVLSIQKIHDDLLEKRTIYKKIVKDTKNLIKDKWELFLPRLHKIVINIEDKISIYRQNFNVQYKINTFFIDKKKIHTIDDKSLIKYVYLQKNKIELNNEINLLINTIPYIKNINKTSYFIENTRNNHYKLIHNYDNDTIYKVLIELFNNNIKTDYDEYKSSKFYELSEDEKLKYVKEQITFSDEESIKNSIKLKSTIITIPKVEENIPKLNTFDILEDLNIMNIEKDLKIKSKMIQKFNDIYTIYSNKKSNMQNIFMSQYIDIQNINKEDADYYADIIFNRARDILSLTKMKENNIYYSEINEVNKLLPNKQNLSIYHKNEIKENIINNNIYKDDLKSLNLPESNIEFFEKLYSIKSFTFINKVVRLKLAFIVLYDILMVFFIKGDKMTIDYLNYKYKNNNTLVNNYNKITKTKEGEKGIEKKLMTDKLEKMTLDYRRLDTELKQRKLGNWSKGLSDNMYKYSKEGYDTELIDNKELLEALKRSEENIVKEYNDDNGDELIETETEVLEDFIEYENEE